MSTHYICFHGEIWKLLTWYPFSCRPMMHICSFLSLLYMTQVISTDNSMYILTVLPVQPYMTHLKSMTRLYDPFMPNRLFYHYSLDSTVSNTIQSAQWGTYTPNQCYRHFLKSTKYVVLTLQLAVVCCMLYYNIEKIQSHIIWSPWPQRSGTDAGIELNKTLAL